MLAHRSTSNSQMSDETSTSSSDTSSEDEGSSEDETYKETEESLGETSSKGSYLHQPWLLQDRSDDKLNESNTSDQIDNSQTNSAGSSTESSSSSASTSASGSSSNDSDDSLSLDRLSHHEGLRMRKTSDSHSSKRKDMPDWELNPEVYGLRRSSRQKKEPSRLTLKDDESTDDMESKRTGRTKKRKDVDARATLTDTSEDESSEYESSVPRKPPNRTAGRPSKLSQLRAKLQRKKMKKISGSKQGRGQVKGRKSTNNAYSDELSSDDNQPVRSSSRILRNNKISYKEHDSSQETDSDEIVEASAEPWNGNEDDNSEAIEKIMDFRVGRLGATGGKTTAYACADDGDPNEDFDSKEEEGERQYLIKWKGWSHPHNTWESEVTLQSQSVRGMKRFENFVKRQEEIELWLRNASPEDREYYYCQSEMNRTVIVNYRKVERVVARSAKRNQHERWDYQVKWCGLPYSECTWEDESLLGDFKKEINMFEMRQENPCVPKQNSKLPRQRPRFVPMTRQPDWLKGLTLRDYQLMGVNWMAHSWCKGNSVILADEMGLGKTIQSITFLSYLYHTHEIYGLFLIIVPLSTMTAWQTEFQIWAPYMNVIVYMGDQSSRATIREVEWLFPNKHYKFNAVLTSYEILLKDKTFLGSHSWVVIAVDEAHRLKNDDSLLYRSLKEFRSDFRLLITGTPLQNSLKELWALLHFIMPERFSSWSDFEDDHAQNRDSGYASLHKVLQPYLLRRQKKDVEKSLPSKVEQILRVPLSSLQKQYYKWLLTKNYAALTRGSRSGFSSFCNIIMELKKCCNHAYLVKLPEANYKDNEMVLQNLLRNSGKMVLLDKLLMRLRENNHRVLIFSQMVRMLDVLQEYLILRRLQFQRLDGSVSSDKRRRALDHFNAPNSEDFCFLLSTRAGGLGINLATADTVIIFDSDWNPMNDLQAQARAHRIGQKNQVNIYRLVCAGTVEEDIIERAKKKMVLDHLVIQRMDTSGKTVLFKNTAPSSSSNNPFNKDELSAILKFGAEELFQDTTGEEKEPECDIDDILRRAETRQEQTEQAETSGLLSAFKVATFNYDEEEEVKKDWSDIIPEKDRSRIAEENRQKQEAELYLPRRARNKIKINAGSESENSDTESSDDDDEAVEDGAPKKRGRPHRSRLREGSDYVRGFTTAEVRRFVRSYRKFGDPLSRLDAIARDAELSEQSEADLRRLGQQLHDKLREMATSAETNQDTTEETAKHGRGRGPSFRLAGVAVSVKATTACTDDLQPLVDCIPRDATERKNFKLNLPVRPIRSWDCTWLPADDSSLLIGIYEYGMGSWEHIQSDPTLNLSKKILRPNGEMPQAKQLQSRADYLIKLLRKAQEQNHPNVPQASSNSKRTTTAPVSRDVKLAPSTGTEKSKRKSRKIKSKSKVELTRSDLEEDSLPGAPSMDPSSNSVNAKSQEKKKKRGRKRKVTEDNGSIPAPIVGEKRKKKHHKDPSNASVTQSNPKVTNTPVSNSNAAASDEFSGELDHETFRDCKERLRPVKKALKQLDRPPATPDGNEQAKNDHIRRCLLQIGDRVIECLRELDDDKEIKSLQRNLWIFVSKFTELSADKLNKLYKTSAKRREFERKSKHEQRADKQNRTDSSTTHHNQESNKSRKIQKKSEAKINSSPLGGTSDNHTTRQEGHDKSSNRTEASSSGQRSSDKTIGSTTSQRFPKSSPQKHSDERHPQQHKQVDHRESWNMRTSGGSPPPHDYRVSARRSRSPPYHDPRSHIPHSPDGRPYRESDYRYHPRPHPPEGYRSYRGSSPGPAMPPMDREWDHRMSYPPPHRYSPPHHHRGGYPYRPRSPPGRSPPSDYRMHEHHYRRHHDPYYPDNRSARSTRYPPYGDSPLGASPTGYSPPISDNVKLVRPDET